MFREIFKQVKKSHGITGKAISQATGISQNHISEYIRGKRNVTDETLWRMIEAMDEMSPGVKKQFGSLLIGVSSSPSPNPQELVNNMDTQQLSDVVFAIADKLRRSCIDTSSQNTDADRDFESLSLRVG